MRVRIFFLPKRDHVTGDPAIWRSPTHIILGQLHAQMLLCGGEEEEGKEQDFVMR